MYSCCLSDKAKAVNNGCFDETCSTSVMRTFSVGSLTGFEEDPDLSSEIQYGVWMTLLTVVRGLLTCKVPALTRK